MGKHVKYGLGELGNDLKSLLIALAFAVGHLFYTGFWLALWLATSPFRAPKLVGLALAMARGYLTIGLFFMAVLGWWMLDMVTAVVQKLVFAFYWAVRIMAIEGRFVAAIKRHLSSPRLPAW